MSTINRDFRFRSAPEPRRHPALRWLLFAAASVVIGVVVAKTGFDGDDNIEAAPAVPQTENLLQPLPLPSERPEDSQRESIRLPLPAQRSGIDNADDIEQFDESLWSEYKVRSGDSMARLFQRAGIDAGELHELMQTGDAATALTRIFPGDVIRLLTDDEGRLEALKYEIDHDSYLLARRDRGLLTAQIHDYETETRVVHAHGVIESSLFMAAAEAGISENIIMELAGIFGWDVDFVLDIRKGDRFSMTYEELFRNGEKIANGDILAAEFINDGKSYKAVRYVNPQTNRAEYFSPDGRSMRKAFLRSPVDFRRISSGFSLTRRHPVLNKIRAHRGVDYAAATGTPIRAAGDGKIVHRANKGGYGRTVIIQHGSKYSTLYAHMSNYKRGHRVGSKVKQGEVIGFVGASGLATGPHLHYEFRVNGVHRNPLTVKLPDAMPVPKRYQLDFEVKTQPLLAQLELFSANRLAANDL